MSLQVTKKQLTSSDRSVLSEYLIRNPDLFPYYYELSPHHTSFSKPVSVQVFGAVLAFKVPDDSNSGRQNLSAELISDPTNFTIDSFSKVYVLPDYVVTAKRENPNYPMGGILHASGDVVRARAQGYTLFAEVFAPMASAAITYVSDAIATDPIPKPTLDYARRNLLQALFGLDAEPILMDAGYAQAFSIALPQLGGNASGPNEPPVVLQIDQRSESSRAPFYPSSYQFVTFNINTNSRFYSNINYTFDQLYNIYMTHVFRAMGYQNNVLGIHYGPSFTQDLESPVPRAPSRKFLVNANTLQAYKDHVGDNNLAGVPMSYQPGTEHLFAGGYHADRFDTADFYFADFFKGGPLNEPIPHPALMGEILSTNSAVSPNNSDEFMYKRHSALEEEYYTPNFIVTEAAMGMIGYTFYDNTLKTATTLDKCFFDKPSSERINVIDGPSLGKMRIRNYSHDKYIVSNYFTEQPEQRHLMITKNFNVAHSVNDKSVDQALRYFGYIPFANTKATHDGTGRSKSAILVDNADKGIARGIEIFKGGPSVLPVMPDYRIYISANASQIHTSLGLTRLGDSIHDGRGLLYKYFMAEVITSVICVGDDALDLEDASSVSLSKTARSIRNVLVLHKDFE